MFGKIISRPSRYLGRLVVFISFFGATAGGATSELNSTARIDELRRSVDPLLSSTDDIEVRHAAPMFTELLELFFASGRQDEARRYLERFLQADPRAYRFQLVYGEMLARQGAPAELEWRAKQAAEYSEEDAIIRHARDLVKLPPVELVPHLTSSLDSGPELVLVPIGEISDIWLIELRDALHRKTGINVSLARLDFEMGPADRTGADLMVSDLRRRLLEGIEKDQELARYLESISATPKVLKSDDGEVIRAARLILAGQPDALQKFNTRLEALKQSGHQWRADRMLGRIDTALKPYRRNGRRFLAVTSVDLYDEDSNFLFGTAYNGGSTGLMSAARFAASFYADSQRRPRLIGRLLKQSLSSYGHMLGVARCSNPECARSYPHTLDEHDAKSDDLCQQCRVGFEQKLGVK